MVINGEERYMKYIKENPDCIKMKNFYKTISTSCPGLALPWRTWNYIPHNFTKHSITTYLSMHCLHCHNNHDHNEIFCPLTSFVTTHCRHIGSTSPPTSNFTLAPQLRLPHLSQLKIQTNIYLKINRKCSFGLML